MGWIPRMVVGLMGLINLVRGAIHAFAPDGGAHSIAGLDLGDDSATNWRDTRKLTRDHFTPGKFVCPHGACFDRVAARSRRCRLPPLERR